MESQIDTNVVNADTNKVSYKLDGLKNYFTTTTQKILDLPLQIKNNLSKKYIVSKLKKEWYDQYITTDWMYIAHRIPNSLKRSMHTENTNFLVRDTKGNIYYFKNLSDLQNKFGDQVADQRMWTPKTKINLF